MVFYEEETHRTLELTTTALELVLQLQSTRMTSSDASIGNRQYSTHMMFCVLRTALDRRKLVLHFFEFAIIGGYSSENPAAHVSLRATRRYIDSGRCTVFPEKEISTTLITPTVI